MSKVGRILDDWKVFGIIPSCDYEGLTSSPEVFAASDSAAIKENDVPAIRCVLRSVIARSYAIILV
jgi:hypothetical protein